MAGHAQLKFVMTECSKTQIRLTGLVWFLNCKDTTDTVMILFSDRQVWANRWADQRSSLSGVYTVCHSVCIFWTHYFVVKRYWSQFKDNYSNFLGCPILGILRYVSGFVLGMPNLAALNLEGTGVNDTGVIEYLSTRPQHLQHLNLNRTEVTHAIISRLIGESGENLAKACTWYYLHYSAQNAEIFLLIIEPAHEIMILIT